MAILVLEQMVGTSGARNLLSLNVDLILLPLGLLHHGSHHSPDHEEEQGKKAKENLATVEGITNSENKMHKI